MRYIDAAVSKSRITKALSASSRIWLSMRSNLRRSEVRCRRHKCHTRAHTHERMYHPNPRYHHTTIFRHPGLATSTPCDRTWRRAIRFSGDTAKWRRADSMPPRSTLFSASHYIHPLEHYPLPPCPPPPPLPSRFNFRGSFQDTISTPSDPARPQPARILPHLYVAPPTPPPPSAPIGSTPSRGFLHHDLEEKVR